jgi:hypothetical protein
VPEAEEEAGAAPLTATTLPSLSASGRVVMTIVPGAIFGLITCDIVSVWTPTFTGTA